MNFKSAEWKTLKDWKHLSLTDSSSAYALQ